MLTDGERNEVVDEIALHMRMALARNPSDVAVSFVEVLGVVFMLHSEGQIPEKAMAWVRKSLERLPWLAPHIEVLAEEALRRARERPSS